jgi:hypothetical protein
MTTSLIRSLLSLIAIAVLAASYARGDDKKTAPAESVDEVIDGILARCSAIKTGTFHFKYGSLWADPAKPKPWPWAPKDERTVFLTVDNGQWVLRWPQAANTEMHRKAYDATYVPTKQRDGTTLHGLRLTPPEATIEKESVQDQKYQIVRAGTIPWPQMQAYLDKNREIVLDRGVVVVEGQKTRLLELVVPRSDYSVLNAYNPVLSSEGLLTLLRIYVIPEMGYVVRRLDYCTPEGQMANRYEANNFKEVARGVYFPTDYYYIRNFHDFGNRKGYYTDRFETMKLSDVNRPIPESAFEVSLPAGTEIVDYRTNNDGESFKAAKPFLLSKVDELTGKSAAGNKEAPKGP